MHEGSQNVDSILVVNSGSSSVKFQIFEIQGRNDVAVLMKGQVDGVGILPRIRVESATAAILLDQLFSREQVPSLPAALNEAARWLRETQHLQPVATGHRVVHGGPDHDRPIVVDSDESHYT
jgi:acetate kinase